jgi:hypothetical protein
MANFVPIAAAEVCHLTAAARAFIRSRWCGDAPLGPVLLWDMLVFGSAVNVVTTVLALLLFAADAPAAAGVAVFFSPLPYNLFLLVSVWRSAANVREPRASVARAFAVVWFLAATMI